MMGDMQVHLKMALAKFEEWFLKHIISHHAKVIKMAEGCLQQAYHGELISLCQNIIVTQSEEINRMQTWLCKWYEYVITGKIYKQDGWMQLKFNDRCRLTCQRLERSYW